MHWLPAILILPYTYLLLKIYRSLRKIKPYKPKPEQEVSVSVVVACRNEEENLPNLLRCLSEQEYPKQLFEIIIIDDNSADKSSEVASEFKELANLNVIYNDGQGKKQALKTGISAASGKLVIATDADCIMGKNWIRIIADFYERYDPDLIICPVTVEPKPGFFGSFQELEFLGLQGITAGTAFQGEATMCNGANLAFERDVFLENADKLHPEIQSGDDVFFLHALKKENTSKILWLESPEAIVTTTSFSNLFSFLDQRSRWISKSTAYNDGPTIILGISTLAAVLLQAFFMLAGFADHKFIWVFIIILLLKSIPDFLVLFNTASRYGRKKIMTWFLHAQIVYPFYVLGVILYSFIKQLINLRPANVNSPFRRET
jgi:poly-beta-1,6-N-acetyl-D-glucosamine synthase